MTIGKWIASVSVIAQTAGVTNTSPALPDWLVAELPTPQPYGRVEPDGPTAVVYISPDGSATRYESVADAYHALQDVDLEFSEELRNREGGFGGSMITFRTELDGVSGYSTMWIASNDSRHIEHLVDSYRVSLANAETYHRAEAAGAPDFLAAYFYLNTHPAFWISSHPDRDDGRWHWQTTGHVNRISLEVWQTDDGGPVVELETGMHTPEMTEHFHDPYLDAAGDTFEAAILQLARNVAVSFHDDGTDTGQRPDNPDADDLVRTIRERTGRTDQPEE